MTREVTCHSGSGRTESPNLNTTHDMFSGSQAEPDSFNDVDCALISAV